MNITIYNTASQVDWLAISAGVIALLALAVSIWQAYSGRQHNRLSSRPLLEFFCYTTTDDISITVKNCGPGPAVLTSTWITYSKIKYNVSDRGAFQKLINLWHEEGLPNTVFYASAPQSTAIVASGDSFDILRVTDSIDKPAAAKFFSNAFRNTIIEITYESLYKETFKAKYEQETFHAA